MKKTGIQKESEVKASKGLLMCTFGKLAIAMLTYVIFYFESVSQLLIHIKSKLFIVG